MAKFRTQGVRGQDLPAVRTLSVVPADFAIGGLLIETERKYNRSYRVTTPEQFAEIFGGQVDPTIYGPDTVNGFFANVVGVDASLYIQSLIGYDTGSSAIDAVVSSRQKADAGADADAYIVEAAYETELQYGIAGNRTGTKFIQADRFSTLSAATVAATGISSAILDSVAGIVVGDLVRFEATGGTPGTVYKKITAVDQSAKTITWSGDFESAPAAGESLAIDDVVAVTGFRVEVYTKSVNGVETEVDTGLGDIVCSSEPEVADFYVEKVFEASKWIKITEASASTLGGRLPVNDSAPVYNTGGADGTTVVTVAAQAAFLANFNGKPIRFLANPETTVQAMQQGLIDYSASRNDKPFVIINIPEDQTKSQLITIGNNYQIAAQVFAGIWANWLKVVDPFATASNAPLRTIPNVGHIMGDWIRTIGINGIHWTLGSQRSLLRGVNEVSGEDFFNLNRDRTDLMEAGINVIQAKEGIGIQPASGVTISTDTAYIFSNGNIMSNFIKISSEDSLASQENTPNTFNRIKGNADAIERFMNTLWRRGSSGNSEEGETFGKAFDDNQSGPSDFYRVTADSTNNSESSIAAGEQNIRVVFSYPAPAGSIEIGVAVLVRG